MLDEKRICKIEGCSNVGEWSHSRNGKIYRRTICSSHRRPLKKGLDYKLLSLIKNQCERCAWVGPCHLHRKDPDVGYSDRNVEILCPNCHTLEHHHSSQTTGV